MRNPIIVTDDVRAVGAAVAFAAPRGMVAGAPSLPPGRGRMLNFSEAPYNKTCFATATRTFVTRRFHLNGSAKAKRATKLGRGSPPGVVSVRLQRTLQPRHHFAVSSCWPGRRSQRHDAALPRRRDAQHRERRRHD
jgi:hypothetical protein